MTVFEFMPRRRIATVVAAAAILSVWYPAMAAGSTTLWYNGDLDQRDAISNQTGAADGIVYDNFVVPVGQTYTINAVFSNDAMYGPLAKTAHWEIRSGISAGIGGTLVASGDGTDTSTYTGKTFLYGGLGLGVYTNEVSGLNVKLTAGTYWLAVAPDVSNQDSYIVTTSGANAIGNPHGNDGNSYFSSTFFGDSFLSTTDPSIEGAGTWDYSMGVIGSSSSAVPEPSSLMLGLIGVIASAGFFRTRRRAGK